MAGGGTLNTSSTSNNGRFIVGTFTGGTLNVSGTANFAASAPLLLGCNGQRVVNLNAGGLITTASSLLALGGGTFAYAPMTAGSTQTVNGTTVNPGNSAVSVTAGNMLNLGTITRTGNGLVSFRTAGGTITASKTGTNGILGPYAYTNTGTNLRYVSFGTVAAYSGGTAAATAAGVTDTTGTANYDVPAGGTVGTGASANTLRYMGAANTITGPLTLNGLMNAGTGALAVNGAVTAGSTSELVVLSNGQNVTLNGAVGNNGTTASALTYGGPTAGTLTLTGASTYTGTTTISAGTLQLGNGGTTGSLSTTSAIIDTGALVFNRTNVVAQGTDFSAVAITGTGSLTQAGSGTLTLTTNNTCTGGTTVNAGTLQLNAGGGAGGVRGIVTVNTGATLLLNVNNALGYTAGTQVATLNINGGTVNTTGALGDEGFITSFNLTGGNPGLHGR